MGQRRLEFDDKEIEEINDSLKTVVDYLFGVLNARYEEDKPIFNHDVYWAAIEVQKFAYKLREDKGWTQESMDFLTMNGDPTSRML